MSAEVQSFLRDESFARDRNAKEMAVRFVWAAKGIGRQQPQEEAMGKGSGGKGGGGGGGGGGRGGGGKPAPGTPAGNNKSNQGNPTNPAYYTGRGQPVPSNLPSGPKPPGK